MRVLEARPLNPSRGKGEAVVVEALSFYGEVDAESGTLRDGRSIAGRVLVIGRVRGSTVGAYVIYGLKYYGRAPRAIIVEGEADPIVVAGSVIAGIPLYDRARGITRAARDGSIIGFDEEGRLVVEEPSPA